MNKVIQKITTRLQNNYAFLVKSDSHMQRVLWFSLLVIVCHFGFDNGMKDVSVLLGVSALLFPRIVYSPYSWFLLFGMQSIDVYLDYGAKANHGWVMWYWSMAITCSFFVNSDTRKVVLHSNARWLLIIVMMVAVFWKAISPVYMSGDFFHRNLVSNPLMTQFTALVTDLDREQVDLNSKQRIVMMSQVQPSAYNIYGFATTEFTKFLALITTWWVLLIELVVGFLLLLYNKRADMYAHLFHLWFILVAYAAAPIVGFGWILLVLGYSLLEGDQKRLKLSYYFVGVCMCVYGLPIGYTIFDLFGLM